MMMVFLKSLQQHVEHVGVSLLDLVEQHHAIGMTAHFLGQLSALLIAYISRRCAYKSRHIEFLHVFAHIDTYQGLVAVEQELGEFLGK